MEMIEKDVMNEYNFVGILERQAESLVVFKLLFGLEYQDIIVLSSKTNGGYDDGGYKNTCFLIQKAHETPTVDTYLKNEFPVHNYDYLMYAVANRSLDLTIDILGRETVEKQVKEYSRLRKVAQDVCSKEAVFPCSSDGTFQRAKSRKSCYAVDNGCGYRCVNRVVGLQAV